MGAAIRCGTTIDFVPTAELPDSVTYYHIETEDHDVILANGAPAETFCDIPGRMVFDNYQEYLDLYGAERIVPEMDRPRVASRRLLPESVRARLGIEDGTMDFDMPASA
ncbi:MAG: Hint domain-containing protein [Rhodobacter sp.]|nr:Hint domain-containing protein [Rhodobacter sp.]